MVTVDNAVIAKLQKNGKSFEILVDPEMAYEKKQGKQVSIQNMLAVNQVFHDSKKGEKASDNDVESAFSTLDIEKITEEILKKGEIQLTTEFRARKKEDKKRQVATIISKNAYDPKTKAPHPIGRIMNAMDQSHVNISAFASAESQVEETVKAIKELLPISMEEIILEVSVPAKHSGRCFGILKEYGKIQKDRWGSDGSLEVTVSVAPSMKEKLFSSLNSSTEGDVKIKEVK